MANEENEGKELNFAINQRVRGEDRSERKRQTGF
jgi:hypothetical protein